jgi:hypothetical protein
MIKFGMALNVLLLLAGAAMYINYDPQAAAIDSAVLRAIFYNG